MCRLCACEGRPRLVQIALVLIIVVVRYTVGVRYPGIVRVRYPGIVGVRYTGIVRRY